MARKTSQILTSPDMSEKVRKTIVPHSVKGGTAHQISAAIDGIKAASSAKRCEVVFGAPGTFIVLEWI